MRAHARSLLIAIGLLGMATMASAQANRTVSRAPRFTVSGGLLVNGGYDLGDRVAELRGNGVSNPAPFTLFRADGSLGRVVGVDGRFAYRLSRALSVEAGGTWSEPHVDVTIAQDAENSGTTLVSETVAQYTVDFGAVVGLPLLRQGSRLRPYAIGGAGYLRQLHEDRLIVETGHTIFGGGGIQYTLRTSARGRSLGVRGEGRFVRRVGGIDFEDKSRTHASLSLLGFAGF